MMVSSPRSRFNVVQMRVSLAGAKALTAASVQPLECCMRAAEQGQRLEV